MTCLTEWQSHQYVVLRIPYLRPQQWEACVLRFLIFALNGFSHFAEAGKQDRGRAVDILRPREAALAAAVLELHVNAPNILLQVSQVRIPKAPLIYAITQRAKKLSE